MNKEEWLQMKNIIDRAARQNNLHDLKEIRSYANEQIKLLGGTNERTEEECIRILNLRIQDLVKMHISSDGAFKRFSLIKAVSSIEKYPLVVDTIGIGKKYLLTQFGLGEYTVEKYEEILNSYGYSLEEELTEETKQKLKEYKK